MLFLDAAITGTPLAEAPVRTEMEMSLWDLCLKGGPLMIVIGALSLVCIYIFIERAIFNNRPNREDPTFMKRIRDYNHVGDIYTA